MQWKTAISKVSDNQEIVRGYSLESLIKNKSFTETIFLILKGNLPNENETKMLNAMLVAAIDHGIGTASAMTSRITASSGNSLHTSLAAGILAMGKLHGGATEDAAKFFTENITEKNVAELVRSLKDKKIRLPGYGHKVLTHDNRTDTVFTVAKETGFYGKYCAFAEEVMIELNKISSKPLPLNVDGAMAAILLDMGFPWQVTKGIFIIARVPGLVAHIFEEMMGDVGLRRLESDETEYIGEADRKL
ncbi:MAG TPA: citryl-CoA lyase [Candidatus Udaeobacter sp.]|nr:citryl-CoA lyase [Candidatus Udaeobacter sp.]